MGNGKFQAPSTKYQTNDKSQTAKTPNNVPERRLAASVCHLVIVPCRLFDA
jgi:hypothetical protein